MFASLLAGLALIGAVGSAPDAAGPAPTTRDLVSPGRIGEVAVSPAGTRLAWARREGGREIVVLLDLSSDARATAMTAPGPGRDISSLAWKDETRLVAGWREDAAGLTVIDAATGAERRLGDGVLVDPLAGEPGRVLARSEAGRRAPVLFALDLASGGRTVLETGAAGTLDWRVDAAGRATIRYDADRRAGLRVMARDGAGRWRESFSVGPKDERRLGDAPVLGFTGERGKFYVSAASRDTAGARTRELRVYDFATGAWGPRLWSHPVHDVAGVKLDGPGGRLSAVCYWVDVYRCDPFDPVEKRDAAALDRLFGPDRGVTVAARSADGAVQALLVTGPDEPQGLYLFDRRSGTIRELDDGHPEFAAGRLSPMTRHGWIARDGTALGGYLTLPKGAAERPPLVVMPHGGPESRDRLRFDPVVQAFAARGYAVFQPNFRGSGGFGAAFAEQGYGQWGRAMQDDVMDGVADLVARGLVDPGRVCIVGASYGGYVALQAGATAPETFRCVVSRAGVADLNAMMAAERARAAADPFRYRYWLRSIGDPAVDRERLRALSPVTRAKAYGPPVLLLHGEDDAVVPVAQSRRMEAALKAAGRPVTLVTYAGEDHDGWVIDNEADALDRMLAFVDAAIGPGVVPHTPSSSDLFRGPMNTVEQ